MESMTMEYHIGNVRTIIAAIMVLMVLWAQPVRAEAEKVKEEVISPITVKVPPATAASDDEGWQSLFDGKTLAGWTMGKGKPVTSGWAVDDGCIFRTGEGKKGSIFADKKYENFELKFEWKISKKGNSGIKYRFNRGKGVEYQVLDDAAHNEAYRKLHPSHMAGSIYGMFSSNDQKVLKPVGEFNKSRIVARGTKIEHWLNGKMVVEADTSSKEWAEAKANSKFKKVKGFGEGSGGLMLQDHGGCKVWYRNIRIRVLHPTDKAITTDTKGLFFREDMIDVGATFPITQKHVANENLTLKLYGPAPKDQIKKSHDTKKKNDSHYICSKGITERWALAFEKKDAKADLSGKLAEIRLRTRNAKNTLHIILNTSEGWVVSNEGVDPSDDWATTSLMVKDLTWSALDIKTVTKGKDKKTPGLKDVSEIGFTDLAKSGDSAVCIDWIEVWERPAPNRMHVVKAVDGYQIYDGNKPVLFYNSKPNTFGCYTRANYVHPVMGLDGEEMTDDFPCDHPHHRGIFWA
ncbi:MAG: hypothetical protein DRR42_25125, partial [Gammaproteobacteria bacterium]